MPKAVLVRFHGKQKRRRIVLSNYDAEMYVRSEKCNRGWLRRQMTDTADAPTHKLTIDDFGLKLHSLN